ncbi:MAG: STAS domain-containing protein [Deltaproteobacteria bacterium]|nr:STAS domain-containing protein [Deltaproteobacteria bacterium]MBW2138555.1 STAS domain-containing protein [Deltaproteobacteria bacterium]
MDILEKKQSDITIFLLKGRLDSNTSPELEERIFESINGGSTKMILDFQDLDYISSAGLRVINKTLKQLKQKEGKLILSSMQDYVREIFEIAGFDSFIPIVSTTDDALTRL